jgi:hypothetical protein
MEIGDAKGRAASSDMYLVSSEYLVPVLIATEYEDGNSWEEIGVL